MSCKVIFVGYVIDKELERITTKIDPIPPIQTIRFSRSLLRVLQIIDSKCDVISMCPVQDYPLVNKIFFRGGLFSYNDTTSYLVPFVNILIIKQLTRFFGIVAKLFKFGNRNSIIFHHGIYLPSLFSCLLMKLLGCKVYVCITDPPSLPLKTDNSLRLTLKALNRKLTNVLLRVVDGGISLSESLVKSSNIKKPFVVLPGIVDEPILANFSKAAAKFDILPSCDKFIVTYAGSLEEQYGVLNLVSAIVNLNGKIKLNIYGAGALSKELKEYAKRYNYIHFGGFISGEHYYKAIMSSDALINVRPPGTFESQHSFPSKLIEYSLTGKPVITTALSSIPEDLYDYFLILEDDSISSIENLLNSVFSLDRSELNKIGNNLKSFVLENYSVNSSAEKLVKIVN